MQWGDVATWVASLVVLASALAGLGRWLYVRSHGADDRPALYRDRVAFWHSGLFLYVRNRGDLPIHNVRLYCRVRLSSHVRDYSISAPDLNIVSPNTDVTLIVTGDSSVWLEGPDPEPELELTFVDVRGDKWFVPYRGAVVKGDRPGTPDKQIETQMMYQRAIS